MKSLREWIKSYYGLYDIEDLQTWGHCGCCGAPIDHVIFEKVWAWGLCLECTVRGHKKP